MKNILFIGNSFTYYNDMPAMVAELASRAGVDLCTVPVTKGGWHLERYADPENEMGKELRRVYPEKTWTYVVLQDHSLQPAVHPEITLTAVRDLISRVLTGSESLLFYQTWAYREGSEKLANSGLDYATMRDRLHSTYEQAAQMTGGTRVPVGDAFSLCRDTHPEIELYQEDAFHPSLAGSYLAACLFCHAIAGLDPLTLTDPEGLPGAEAAVMRHIAKETLDRSAL